MKSSKIKTFSIPPPLQEIRQNVTNNVSSKLSKEDLLNLALEFHSQGNTLQAAKYYQIFIKQGTKDPRIICNYGSILYGLGKLKEAEIYTRKAIELKPDLADAHLNMGAILINLGNLEEAEIYTRKAIELKPDDAEANSNLGSLLRNLGKLKEAEIYTRKAIELEPNLAQAHYTLGYIFTDFGKLEQAETSFKQAIKLKFGFVKAHDALTSVLEKLGRNKEAKESANKVLHIKSIYNSKLDYQQKEQKKLFKNPSQLEYPSFYRPGMGTENVGAFLRSMIMMLRPKRILEIGAGYTTPFLLEALINNERVFDDGNLNESYFQNYIYDAKLIVIDNQSLGELTKVEGMEEIINSKYTDFVEGNFEGKGAVLYKKYGHFDFVWFDCGGPKEYKAFIEEFWEYCSNYIFFHFTYSNGAPNLNHKIIQDHIKGNPVTFDIVEPHKKRQGSISILQKKKDSY